MREMEAKGYLVVKLIKTNCNGIPDLLCLKDGEAIFIECKEAKDTVKPLQEFRIKQLTQLGFQAYVNKAK
jgi:Holliday junction resolvase